MIVSVLRNGFQNPSARVTIREASLIMGCQLSLDEFPPCATCLVQHFWPAVAVQLALLKEAKS